MSNWDDLTAGVLDVETKTFNGRKEITFNPDGEPSESIQAIFDRTYIGIDPDTGAEVSSTNPVLFVQLSQMTKKPTPDDSFTVDGENFEIIDSDEDGQGGATIFLNSL